MLPLDVFPEFAPPLIEVQTEAPGLSTEEVESLISVPLENALNGTIGLKTIRSKSVLGLSSVVLILKEGSDLMSARQVVQERLAVEAARLPAAARQPVILSPLSSTSRLLKIGVSSKTLSQMDLTILAKWNIRPRLMAIPGVANVAIWGQRDRQYQVLVDPERLRLNGVDARRRRQVGHRHGGRRRRRVHRHAQPAHRRPPPRGHRRARRPRQDHRRLPQRCPLRLGDIAEVRIGFPPPIGDAVINDGEGLLLIVEKQPTGNTLEVTRQVEKAIEDLKPGLKGVDIDPTIFRPGDVHRAIPEQSLRGDDRRLRAGDRHPAGVPLRLAHGRDQPHGDSAVVDRRDSGPDSDGCDAQHDGHRGPGDRDGRGG